jgi:hypothetical protein
MPQEKNCPLETLILSRREFKRLSTIALAAAVLWRVASTYGVPGCTKRVYEIAWIGIRQICYDILCRFCHLFRLLLHSDYIIVKLLTRRSILRL